MDTATLKLRQQCITSTDIPRLLGYGFGDDDGPLKVYREKVAEEPGRLVPNLPMRLGLATEELNRQLYVEKTGVITKPAGQFFQDRLLQWCGTSLDFIAEGGKRIVETKYVAFESDEWGEPGTDQVPTRYLLQTQWQMGVTAIPVADVSALFGHRDHRVYTVQFNPDLFALLLQIAAEFHTFVERRTEPPEDWRPAKADQIDKVAVPMIAGKTVAMSDQAVEMFELYRAQSEAEKEASKQASAAKAWLAALLGDAEAGEVGGWKIKRGLVAESRIEAYTRKAYETIRITPPRKKGQKGIAQ